MKKFVIFLPLLLAYGMPIIAERYIRPFTPYYSQCGQDKYLNETIFKNKKNGIFVEIGAHDGINFSNTYYFESILDWTGICVEPHPDRYKELELNRNCICIEACISDVPGTAEFLMITGAPEMLSGLYDKYESRHLDRVNVELETRGGSKQLIPVECIRFNDLMKAHNITYIDILSVDTEGNEEDIISSIDFDMYYIKTIVVENNFDSNRIRNFLQGKGFSLIKNFGGDDIFVNQKEKK